MLKEHSERSVGIGSVFRIVRFKGSEYYLCLYLCLQCHQVSQISKAFQNPVSTVAGTEPQRFDEVYETWMTRSRLPCEVPWTTSPMQPSGRQCCDQKGRSKTAAQVHCNFTRDDVARPLPSQGLRGAGQPLHDAEIRVAAGCAPSTCQPPSAHLLPY